MDRRQFLRRSGLAVAGGLVAGNAALELFERLTHRKVWALGGLPTQVVSGVDRWGTVRYVALYSSWSGTRIAVLPVSDGDRLTADFSGLRLDG